MKTSPSDPPPPALRGLFLLPVRTGSFCLSALPLLLSSSAADINPVINDMLSLPQKRPSERVMRKVDNDSTRPLQIDPDAF